MPIFEYVCGECGEKFEKLVRSASAPCEVVCPKCGAKKVEKAFSLFGVSGGRSGTASVGGGGSCAPTGG